ncbi:ATP-binding protein [Candidatus Omnitrophota bacterium]
MKIRTKLIVAFLAIALLVLLVGYFSYNRSQKILEQAIGENAASLTEQITDQVEHTLLWTAFFITIIAVFLGLFVSRSIYSPITKLKQAIVAFGEGKLDTPIEVKTGDEIEELAVAFQEMARKIQEKQKELVQAQTVLQDWSQGLERTIAERTKEVTNSQEATLNIMEDLQEAYNQLKLAQSQLVQAGKLEVVGRLASGIAHEVKNPLGIVLQGINFLEGKLTKKQKKNTEILGLMKSNLKRADNIVRALLDFSRAQNLELKPQGINAIIRSSLGLLKHGFKLEDIEVVEEVEANLPAVLLDAARMEQVFVNIFLNAIQAMPKGGQITIRARQGRLVSVKNGVGRRSSDAFTLREQAVIIEVEDTGIGIAPKHLQNVFDPFFTTKAPGRGTGLGLAVTKNIIDLHHGLIEMESQEGQGTKVIIILKIPGEDNEENKSLNS